MSSSSENNGTVDILFGILCVVGGVVAVGFAVYWLLYQIAFGVCWAIPYLLFGLLPFGLLTAAYGFWLAALCKIELISEEGAPDDQRPKQKLPPRSTHYRQLAVLFPVFVVATYAIFGLPEAHQVVTEKVVVQEARMERMSAENDVNESGEYGESVRPKYRKKPAVTRDESRTVQQWPWLVGAFNRVNSSWQDRVPFVKKGKAYQSVLFDRNVWSCLAWVCLLLSGPILFWLLSGRDLRAEDRDMVWSLDHAVGEERRIWESRQAAWKETEAEISQHCKRWHEMTQAKQREIEVLTAKLDFTPAGLKIKIEEKRQKPGVLDSDLL